jgi:hypothetical protein
MKMSDEQKHWSGLEPQQRADSPQVLPVGSASRAAGLASESENSHLPYGRREALPQGRTFPAACCRESLLMGLIRA